MSLFRYRRAACRVFVFVAFAVVFPVASAQTPSGRETTVASVASYTLQ
jgi:hypothetical protein